jgi:hypothetical protein
MATDLTLYLDDQPGELARVASLLGQAGVNIEGYCALRTGGGKSEVHLLVEDLEGAFTALSGSQVQVAAEQEVAVLPVLADRPGVLGEVSRALGEAGVNITLTYVATNTRLVLGVDDLSRAKAALDSLA